MTSSERVHFGLKWMGLSQGLSQIVRFISTAILARLLVPEMFGLVAMANVSVGLVGLIGEAGLGSAFIQRRSDDAEGERVAANTVFAVLFALNTALFVLAWMLTPLIADFFHTEEVAPILRAMLCVFLIAALTTTASMILQKRLDFGRIAACGIVSGVCRAGTAIPLAALGYGVWSLVLSHLASEVVRTGMLIRASGWRPSIDVDFTVAKELIGYGKFLWAFAALSTIGDSLDRLLTGRWLGAAQLGVYGMALELARLPATEIARLVNNIAFPSLARVQDQHEVLTSHFRKALSHVSFVAIPVGFGMMAVSEDLILTVYGEKWRAAIPVLQILSLYGIALAVSSTTGPLFKATGRPQLLLYTSVLHHSLQLALLLLLGRYGLAGIATAVVVPMMISALIAFLLIARVMDFGTRGLLSPILRATACALIMLVAVTGFDQGLDGRWNLPVALSLVLSAGFGAIVYLAGSLALNRATLIDFIQTIRGVATSRGELI